MGVAWMRPLQVLLLTLAICSIQQSGELEVLEMTKTKPMTIKLHDNPALRTALAALKVRLILSKGKGK